MQIPLGSRMASPADYGQKVLKVTGRYYSYDMPLTGEGNNPLRIQDRLKGHLMMVKDGDIDTML